MQIQIDGRILSDVAMEVLEQTAFMFSDAADLNEGINLDKFEFIEVSLEFAGDQSGEVVMIAPTGFCRELAGNMLGEDIDEGECYEKNMDALKEILNIISGEYLIRVYGDKAIFDLSAPVARGNDPEELNTTVGKKEFACCLTDDYPVLLYSSQIIEAP